MWLRSDTVNILRYLPEFVAKDTNFHDVGVVLSEEHEKQRFLIQDIFDQMFIQTATWGLASWEKLIGITPHQNASYDDRRRSIMLRLQAAQVSTLDFMTRLVERYTDDCRVTIEEHNDEYYFRIIIDGAVIDTSGLIDALEIYKPAHLGYKINLIWKISLENAADRLHYGLADCHLGRKRIRIPPPDDASIKARSGVCYFRSGRMRIGAGEEPPPSVLAQRVGVLAYRIGRVRIPYNPADKGQAHESRLYPAGAGHHIGLSTFAFGRRHIGLPAPTEAESMAAAGIASATIGRKRIGSAAPPESSIEPRGGRVILRTGRITIYPEEEK